MYKNLLTQLGASTIVVAATGNTVLRALLLDLDGAAVSAAAAVGVATALARHNHRRALMRYTTFTA